MGKMKNTILLLTLILIASTLFAGCIIEKDTDNDGYADNVDDFPNDARYNLDSDKDGYADEVDAFPNDARYHLDTDRDGYADEIDDFPNDMRYHSDYDGDGYADEIDEFPHDARYYSQVEKNIKICEEVAQEYYKTHTYVENDVFDCDNMAQDVWNILKTKGINAEIAVGNVDLDKYDIEDCNHVWILAEVSPNKWLAIECTGGYTVYNEDNPRYYYGHTFKNPKALRDFSRLYETYNTQYINYIESVRFYNALVEEYNNADYFTQLYLKSGLQVAELEIEKNKRDLEIIFIELEVILEYG